MGDFNNNEDIRDFLVFLAIASFVVALVFQYWPLINAIADLTCFASIVGCLYWTFSVLPQERKEKEILERNLRLQEEREKEERIKLDLKKEEARKAAAKKRAAARKKLQEKEKTQIEVKSVGPSGPAKTKKQIEIEERRKMREQKKSPTRKPKPK